LENSESWKLRLLGPLGKALDHFCSCRLTEIDFDVLLEPFRTKKGPEAKENTLLWGTVVSAGITANHFISNEILDRKLRKTIADMLKLQEKNGCISAWPKKCQLQNWDVASRRNLLKALLKAYTFMGKDKAIRQCCVNMMDHFMTQVGEGKRSILHCGMVGGLDSSAILDAVVGVWQISRQERFLAFARYIASMGFSQQHNVLEALQTGLSPCELGNGNAVWLNACFQGLAELSLIDVDFSPRWRKYCKLYFDKIVSEELFLTGTGGGVSRDGSYWCKGALAQTAESCRGGNFGNSAVTSSCLNFFEACHRAVHSSSPAAWAERTLYNALLGAWEPETCSWGYLAPGPLSAECTKTYLSMEKGVDFYNFAAAEGLLQAPLLAAMPLEGNGIQLNLYEDMNIELPSGSFVKVRGNHPVSNFAQITIKSRNKFTISLRIPEYCTGVYYEDCLLKSPQNSYLTISRKWSRDETLTLKFDPKAREVAHPGKEPFTALMRGPLVLTESSAAEAPAEFLNKLQYNKRTLIDFASAGRPGNNYAPFTVWFPKQLPKYLYHYFDYD